jgi:hypothetical protein
MKRRDFVRNCFGLGAMGLPSLGFAEASGPKRILIFYTQHGAWYDSWKMRLQTTSTDHMWHFSLDDAEYSESLQPLSSFAHKSIVVDGLALVSAELDVSGLRHELGGVHSLTGSNMMLVGSVPLATSASLDQLISPVISVPGQFSSLELGVGENPRSVIYRGAKDTLPMCDSPIALARRLFGADQQSSLHEHQEKLLSAVHTDYQRLSSLLSDGDKIKVEQHADLLLDVQTQLQGLDQRRTECNSSEISLNGEGYNSVFESFVPLISTAFSCDLTRVISVQMGQVPSSELFSGQTFDLHTDAAHKVWNSTAAAEMMTQYSRYHATQLYSLISQLDSTIDPLGDGIQTLLDNTMVLWVGELGDGAHGFERWPAMIIGGNSFSSFQYNRYLYHPSHTPVEGWSFLGNLPSMALPHQLFLNSIASQFGISTGVGETHLLDGSIDCSGILEGLV